MNRFMWWHSLRKHRMRCDISRYRMVTVCDCGKLWVTLGDPPYYYADRGRG